MTQGSAAGDPIPAGHVCDAARELWDANRIVGQIAAGPWRIARPGAVNGPAYTVRIARARRPREDALEDWFQAFDHVPEGAVVVVEAVGELRGAVIGDACAHRLAQQGARGVIVDGIVKDYDGIAGSGLPSWVRGAGVEGMLVPLMHIEAGVPIRCGGVPVAPGDTVAADGDGIFVVPQEDAEAVLEIARGMAEAEQRMFALIAEGQPIREVYAKTGRA